MSNFSQDSRSPIRDLNPGPPEYEEVSTSWARLLPTHSGRRWVRHIINFVSSSRTRDIVLRPDDGGSTHLWNVNLLQCDYRAHYPKRLSYSYSYIPQHPSLFNLHFKYCNEIRRHVVQLGLNYTRRGNVDYWQLALVARGTARVNAV
jgi:hypothetical protein